MKVLVQLFKNRDWLEATVASRKKGGSNWKDMHSVDITRCLIDLSISGEDAIVLSHDKVVKLMTGRALTTRSLEELKAEGMTIDEVIEVVKDAKQARS